MNLEEYRRSRKKEVSSSPFKKWAFRFVSRVFLSIILFLIGLIVSRNNATVKNFINEKVYTTNIKFAELKKKYNQYFGKYFGTKEKDTPVFTEKLSYSDANIYKDGVKLSVSSNYLIPSLESGIVIFIGNKEGYGDTLIIEQIDGVDVWYCDILVKDLKMYDYVEKGALIGTTKSDKLYLLFQKDGKYLDYKNYI